MKRIERIEEEGDVRELGNDFAEQLQPFALQVRRNRAQPRDVFAPDRETPRECEVQCYRCSPRSTAPLAAKKNSMLGTVPDGCQRAIPHLGSIAHPLFRTLNDNVCHPRN
jgi:hypothetical protein